MACSFPERKLWAPAWSQILGPLIFQQLLTEILHNLVKQYGSQDVGNLSRILGLGFIRFRVSGLVFGVWSLPGGLCENCSVLGPLSK